MQQLRDQTAEEVDRLLDSGPREAARYIRELDAQMDVIGRTRSDSWLWEVEHSGEV